MSVSRSIVFSLIAALCAPAFCVDQAGENIVEMKLALPKGDSYMRGASDPVADLYADIAFSNKTQKENRVKKTVQVQVVSRLTTEEVASLKNMSPADQKALLEKKIGTRDIEETPVNENSLGYAYVEPQLGPVDNIEFIITKLPDEGEAAPAEGVKPVAISRDALPDRASRIEAQPTKYVAAGETSPVYSLPVGKFYLLRSPGMYSIKAQMRSIPDSNSPTHFVVSNEEKFRVLPFKIVDQRIGDLKASLQDFERGHPDFDYMLYQLKSDANFDQVYALQRIVARGVEHWEWTPICTVKTGAPAQVAQLAPKKVALLVLHGKGDTGLYKLDFSGIGVKIETQVMPAKEGVAPKLKVEGGNVSVE